MIVVCCAKQVVPVISNYFLCLIPYISGRRDYSDCLITSSVHWWAVSFLLVNLHVHWYAIWSILVHLTLVSVLIALQLDSLLKRFIIHCCYRPLLKRFIAVIVVSIRFWSTDRFIIILLKGLDCFWCIPWLHKSICHRAILVQNKLVVAKKLLVESLSSIAMATSREMQNVLRIHFPASLCQSWLCLWSYPASFSMDHW